MAKKLPETYRNSVQGKLEVKAAQETRRGLTDHFVPAGTVGYVVGVKNLFAEVSENKVWLVFWPAIRVTSAHPKEELTITGQRGSWPYFI